jgi:hypothetical protein
MKKTILILCLFAAVIGMSAFISSDEPHYKNLKVLPKNISKHDLDSTMKSFTASLGVKCTYCHVHVAQEDKWYFDNDGMPNKLIARKMMAMTAKINKKFFKPEEDDKDHDADQTQVASITCYTCHRGHEMPETKPQQWQQPKKD